MVRIASICLASLSYAAIAQIPMRMQGLWGGDITQSILGPIRAEDRHDNRSHSMILRVSSPDAAGNFFLRQLDDGQLFRVQGTSAQYCFAYATPFPGEAPFVVHSSSDVQVQFCWRGPRIPTLKANCSGCDCAQWTLRLEGDKLHSEFMMSPPALHLKMDLVRIGSPQTAEEVRDGWLCDFDNKTDTPDCNSHPGGCRPRKQPPMCSVALSKLRVQPELPALPAAAQGQPTLGLDNCVMLNLKRWVRFQYTASKLPCWPCEMKFSISAPTLDSEYVAIGFKGQYEAYHTMVAEEPQYWGMASATAHDPNEVLPGRLLVAYVNGSGHGCVQHKTANEYVGSPIDVPDDGIIHNTSVTRAGGMTTLTFLASVHAGNTTGDLYWTIDLKTLTGGFMSNRRVMWAVGAFADKDACDAEIQYHWEDRGLAMLGFPDGRWPCEDTASDMLDTDAVVIV